MEKYKMKVYLEADVTMPKAANIVDSALDNYAETSGLKMKHEVREIKKIQPNEKRF